MRDFPSLPVVIIQLALAALAGIGTALQPGVNSRFADAAGHRVHGGVINFAIGLVTMLLVWTVTRIEAPAAGRLAQGPWWMWFGGVLGAFFVTTAVFLVPRMGTASYVAAMVAGQLIASLAIDHFGLVGMKPSPLTFGRALGAILIFGGMLCIRFL